MPYGTVSADLVVGTNGGRISPENTFGFRNRLINGAMVIDQRNSGASVTTVTAGAFTYTLDRWSYFVNPASKFTIQQNAGATTPPTGYINYLGCTSASAYSVAAGEYQTISQTIEGLNITDLAWGTANAKTVTLSFQVYSSLTGTFGGALTNSANNRSNPFTYSIPTANTWTPISVTIAGDTSGTWLTTNGKGIQLTFGLGVGSTFSGTASAWAAAQYFSATGATSVVGTNGATFYITGVQLEVGTNATSFEYRPYGTELALCQRYFLKSYDQATVPGANISGTYYGLISTSISDSGVSTYCPGGITFPVQMRTNPTIAYYDAVGNGSKFSTLTGGGLALTNNVGAITSIYSGSAGFQFNALPGAGNWAVIAYTASAEL